MCGQDRTQESIWEDGCSCNGQGSGAVVEEVHEKDLKHRLVLFTVTGSSLFKLFTHWLVVIAIVWI